MTTSKYIGMTQEQLIQEVKQAFVNFHSTFEKPSNEISINEVSKAFDDLKAVHSEIHSLVSVERSAWYMYRNHNQAWSEWEYVNQVIKTIIQEAWRIVETKDWSVYQD